MSTNEPTPTATLIRDALHEHLLASEVLPLFSTGRLVITNGVQARFGEQTLDTVAELLTAHSCRYWGNRLPAGDWQANDDPNNIELFERLPSAFGKDFEPCAVRNPGRVLASWRLPDSDECVWVITEPGENESVTTVLLASEY
jgi:hypothetical protein